MTNKFVSIRVHSWLTRINGGSGRNEIGFWIWVAGFALLLLLSQPSTLHAQPAPPPNRVLELDGRKSYVELPTNVFQNLTQATIECWVRFEEFVSDARVFDFGAGTRQFYVSPDQTRPTLKVTLADPIGGRHRIYVAGLSGRGVRSRYMTFYIGAIYERRMAILFDYNYRRAARRRPLAARHPRGSKGRCLRFVKCRDLTPPLPIIRRIADHKFGELSLMIFRYAHP